MPFRNRAKHTETDLCPHQEDLDPDAKYFSAVDGAATEEEYLKLLRSLVEIFKPSHVLETGSYMGDGTFSILAGLADSPFTDKAIVTINGDELPPSVNTQLSKFAKLWDIKLNFVCANTNDIINEGKLHDLTEGKTTFAFLDSSIPDRLKEFEYIINPANLVLDFTRPICICVHDMSKYRHPDDCDSSHLQHTVDGITQFAQYQGWQFLRLNQSRGMLILVRYPN